MTFAHSIHANLNLSRVSHSLASNNLLHGTAAAADWQEFLAARGRNNLEHHHNIVLDGVVALVMMHENTLGHVAAAVDDLANVYRMMPWLSARDSSATTVGHKCFSIAETSMWVPCEA